MTDDLTKEFESFKSLDSVYRRFTTNRYSKEWLARIRWKDGIRCPHCGGTIIYSCKESYHCEECNRNFTVTVGTIFESTKLPLRKWYAAIWLTINNKKGISASMLSRELNVSYPTAWYMLHKLRRLLPQEETKLEGAVQVDCGYIGGLLRWTNKRHDPHSYLRNKVALVGLASSTSYRIKVIDEGNWNNIKPILTTHCSPSNTIFTDEGKEFFKISKELNIDHYTTNHETRHWKDRVTGATTSKVESCWSHIRRHHKGIYHILPKKRSQRYVDEFVYRYNTLNYDYKQRACDFFGKIFLVVTWREIATSY